MAPSLSLPCFPASSRAISMQSGTASLCISHRLWTGAGIKRMPLAQISHSQRWLRGRQALAEETADVPASLRGTCTDMPARRMGISAPKEWGLFFWGGCQVGRMLLPHGWVQALAAVQVPAPSAPCFVPRNPDGRARDGGAVGTLAVQGGGHTPTRQVQNIFHALTSAPQGSLCTLHTIGPR